MLPQIDHFAGPAFEEICRQYFGQARLSGKLAFLPTRIGRWWDAHEEIDLIVIGKDEAIFVECKWSNRAVESHVLTDLEREATGGQRKLGKKRVRFAFCSHAGYSAQLTVSLAERSDVLLLDPPKIPGQG